MYDSIGLNLKALLESIDKIILYSKEFSDADEIWDIIHHKLVPLKHDIRELLR